MYYLKQNQRTRFVKTSLYRTNHKCHQRINGSTKERYMKGIALAYVYNF